MMKYRRKKSLTASVIKYDFSYSVNSKTIIFPPLSRGENYKKSVFVSYAAKYVVLMGKFFDMAKKHFLL